MAAVDAEHPVVAIALALVEECDVQGGRGVEVLWWRERHRESHCSIELAEGVFGGHVAVVNGRECFVSWVMALSGSSSSPEGVDLQLQNRRRIPK